MQKVAVAPLRIARLDGDRHRSRRAANRSRGDVERGRRRPLALERVHDRREERAIAAPLDPQRAPAVLHVGSKDRGPPEPDGPEREQRIAVGRAEHLERRLLHHRGRDPLERRQPRKVNGAQEGRGLHDRLHLVFLERRRAGVLRFLHENLRQLLRIRDHVLLPLAPRRDAAKKFLVGRSPDGDGRHGHFRVDHLAHEPLVVVGVRPAVGQQDDVLGARLDGPQREVRLLEGGKNQRPPARLDRRDLAADLVAVLADVADLHIPVELVVEREDADGLFVGHHVDGRLRRRLAQVHRRPGHAPRPIQHQHERERRLVFLFEGDRSQALERRAPVSPVPFAEHRVAAGHEQPAAVLHPGRERRHRAARNRRAGDVAKDDDVVRVEAGRRGGQTGRRTHRYVEPGAAQRARKIPGARLHAFDV